METVDTFPEEYKWEEYPSVSGISTFLPESLNGVCCQRCKKAEVGIGDMLLSAKTF